MRRVGGLWDRLVSFDNLVLAARKAGRGKGRKPNVVAFRFHLEREILAIQRELADGTYRPGPYRAFPIREPKPRLISAAPFRDRVVHHALMNLLAPVLERGFIEHSFANREGKGTHAAVRLFQRWSRRRSWVLKGDVAKYFPSIDLEILKALVARKVKDRRVLDLVGRIVDASNPQEPVVHHFPGDDLYTPFERRRGLPLGNLTSQWLANLYLDPLDHFVKEVLRERHYLRYVDDFVVLGDDPSHLHEVRRRIGDFLVGLRLRLHPDKCQVFPVARGTRLLGFRVFPDRVLLPKQNARRAGRRMRRLARCLAAGEVTAEEVRASVHGWLGHARHARSWRVRRRVLGELMGELSLRRGKDRASRVAGRVVEQQSGQPALCQPQQEHPRQPEQQQRGPRREHSTA